MTSEVLPSTSSSVTVTSEAAGSSPRNLQSDRDFHLVVGTEGVGGGSLGHICGPFVTQPLPDLCISPVGVVHAQVSGKYCLFHERARSLRG